MSDEFFPRFRERAPWFGPDLQTIRNALRPPPPEIPRGQRLLLPLRDGDKLAARLDRPASVDKRPLIVLVHGLTGSEASVNVVATARHLVHEGWRVLRLNLRGSAFSRPTSAGRYHAGRTGDLAEALRQIPAALLAHGVVLVGHSLGGNLILKFMGNWAMARSTRPFSAPSPSRRRSISPRPASASWRRATSSIIAICWTG